MSTFLYRLGRFAARRPWVVIGAWSLAVLLVVLSSAGVGRELEDSFGVPGVDSQAAADLLSDAASDRAGLTAQVVATPTEQTTFADPTARIALDELTDAVERLSSVIGVDQTVSPDGRVALLRVQYPVLGELRVADLGELETAVEGVRGGSTLTIEMGGDLFFAFAEGDDGTAELFGLGAAVVILLVAFGSIVAMGLPLVVALFGLLVGASLLPLVAYVVDVPSWAPEIGSMIGLGVGIDYALLLVTRHREHLSNGMSVVESAGRAVATSGQAVVFAGGTVVIAILGLGVAGVPFMTAAGIGMSVIVAVMVVAAITLLPALLGLVGPWIDRLGIHRRHGVTGEVGAGWRRWGEHVSRHAWPYAIGVTAVLLALTAPVLALDLGFPDEGTQPESQTQRRAYDLVADGFGPGINGPLVVAVDTAGDVAIVDELATAVAADDGIAGTAPPEVDDASAVATIIAFPTTEPQDSATFETVERLRTEVIPAVLDGSAATAHIGGQTATFGDVGNRVSERLPVFIVAVVALSFLLLTVVFRSVLVPLKAALLNLLSIGAAYGILVMVFQWGWGKGLIGLETTVPIVSFIPMFMFAVLFGLSMDYEVFLLSRVREEYLETGDNDEAVIGGIANTARVITSAALIMISVFGGFVLGHDPTVKMMGLGLATAILVDATVVRIVLVPATMKLLGDANWWLPGWLDRLLPEIDIEALPDVASPATGVRHEPAPEDSDVDGVRELVG